MRLKFRYERVRGGSVDIVVTTELSASVGDLAEEILGCDPMRPSLDGETLTLSAAAPGTSELRPLDPQRAVGDSKLASGWTVRVVPWTAPTAGAHRGPSVDLVVEDGPEAGRRTTLGPGSHVLGRDASADVLLSDPMISKRHARLHVGDVIELVDLNSANGILIDGGLIQRWTVVDDQPVVLGETTVRFEVRRAEPERNTRVVGGAIPFNRSPRVQPRYAGRELPAPEIPRQLEKPPFPWLVMVAPLVGGVLMYFLTHPHNMASIALMALSPLMMVGNYWTGRRQRVRKSDSEVGRFEAQFAELRQQLEAEVPVERTARSIESPELGEVLDAIQVRGPLLWSRRPEHWSFLSVRLGTGTAPSRTSVEGPGGAGQGLPEFSDRLAELVADYRLVDEVPIVENPLYAGALGVVAGTDQRAAIARGLLLQWTGLHSPAELVVVALTASHEAEEFAWLKWLPHTSSAFSPLSGTHLADSAATAATILAQLEEIAETRREGEQFEADLLGDLEEVPTAMRSATDSSDGRALPPLPVVVVLVTEDAPVDSGRVVQLMERAGRAGFVPLYLAGSQAALPAACRTFLVADEAEGPSSATVHYVRHGLSIPRVRLATVSREEAFQAATALAPVVDAGALVADASDLPRAVPMLALIGDESAGEASAIVDRWTQNQSLNHGPRPVKSRPSSLRALVGHTGAEAMHLDLRSQGPHALVGGTTGAGKSEFLQAWVLGMAAEYSPDRVTFLFVDYKGGAAFAECVGLPHCVGLVTDLSPHLVRRALTSLRAELRHREHLLNAKGAKDLAELEKRGDPSAPPSLVLVIDEFAALVGEVPEFVDGVVDIAQRGRSLGIHLIMATQRPAGVIKDNLRANTNLRIALRMADEADSSDVVGVPDAGHFDPGIPGRALAKTGPGRLLQFQSAYAGGHSGARSTKPTTLIHELRFGAEVPWEPPVVDEVPESALGPADLSRLVTSIGGAAEAASVAAPRRPWLDELESTYDLAALRPGSDAELLLGMGDFPDNQEQRAVQFHPDDDGHLIVYGTGASGKSVLLRTLAAGAGITPMGGPVDVYALDFAAGGLRMLDALPNVGAVIPAEDQDRVMRLFRMLKSEFDRRGREYPADVDSIVDYRRAAGRPDEPRILLLLDGFPAFRSDFEGQAGRAEAYATLLQLLTDGRRLGLHVVLTADRPGSVPSQVASSVPRRVVLRLAEDAMYSVLDVPRDVLNPQTPAGRAIVDQVEMQVAVLGGSADTATQSRKLTQLGAAMRAAGRVPAPPISSLPTEALLAELPPSVDGMPVLAISDETLAPVGFVPEGTLLLGGGPGSGRSNALLAITRSLARWEPQSVLYYFGGRRSALVEEPGWKETATNPEAAAELARTLASQLVAVEPGQPPVCVVVESIGDFFSSPADSALVELTKAVRRTGNLLIAEAEASAWTAGWPLFGEVKAGRRGILLQPDPNEGESIFRIPFPRARRNDFPPGRGVFVQGGKAVKVQIPLA